MSTELLQKFESDGIVKITLPAEIQAFQREFANDACAWLKRWTGCECASPSLAADMVRIAKENRALVGRLYKVARRFAVTKQMACHPFLVDLAKTLMQAPLVSCCNFVAVRFDLPSESKYLLDAHQDFPYIQGSLNGITIWMPFNDADERVGSPSWIPGSHRWGVLRVREFSLEQAGGSGGRSFELVDFDRLAGHEFVREDVRAGEALAFHTLLVHRSEPNTSGVARMSAQLRYDDVFERSSFERNYPEGLYLNNRLTDTYPEYVARERPANGEVA